MDNNPLVFVIGLVLSLIFCSLLTTGLVVEKMQIAAVKANVAYYELNENTGKVNFKYKQISEEK